MSLLTEAGYPDGFEMELDTDPAMKEIAEALAGQLGAVGIDVTVNIFERPALVVKYEPGGSQAFLTSWGNSEADADGILSKQFYSKRYGCDLVTYEYPAPESGFGDSAKGCYYTGYGNAVVDAAVKRAKSMLIRPPVGLHIIKPFKSLSRRPPGSSCTILRRFSLITVGFKAGSLAPMRFLIWRMPRLQTNQTCSR